MIIYFKLSNVFSIFYWWDVFLIIFTMRNALSSAVKFRYPTIEKFNWISYYLRYYL